MDPSWEYSPSSISMPLETSTTSTTQTIVQMVEEQGALITPPPELRLRSPIPEPQNIPDCGEATRSASEAIRQANQSASQAIQQATQQASQAIQQAQQQATQSAQQASQSADEAVRQFSNQASQSIAAASRSVASAVSSADQAVANAKSSADAAIGSANGAMITASIVQADASRALFEAGVAVSTAAAAAASLTAEANDRLQESRTAAVTATQAALAIVGSVIASALITILLYFLITRHKRSVKRNSRGRRTRDIDYSSDSKLIISDQGGTTIAASNVPTMVNETRRGAPSASFSISPNGSENNAETGAVKTTTVPWNPSKPPKAPTLAPSLGSWLKLQDGVSPFRPIKLPDEKSPAPLGGQLKSPLQSITARTAPTSAMKTPMMTPANSQPESPRAKSPGSKSPRESNIPTATWSSEAAKLITISDSKRTAPSTKPRSPLSPKRPDTPPRPSKTDRKKSPAPQLKRGPARVTPSSVQQTYGMVIPSPVNSFRNTADWLAARQAEQDSVQTNQAIANPRHASNDVDGNRGASGRPGNAKPGWPARPGPRHVEGIKGEVGYVEGSSEFLTTERGRSSRRGGGERSGGRAETSGVGRAL